MIYYIVSIIVAIFAIVFLIVSICINPSNKKRNNKTTKPSNSNCNNYTSQKYSDISSHRQINIYSKNVRTGFFTPEEKIVGIKGERIATKRIISVMREDDVLITNLNITVADRDTELDNVIINKYGVFIIETKYLEGRLSGNEKDYYWEKYSYSSYGNLYKKEIRNPIRQVNRQIYLLSDYLKHFDEYVWIEGYVYFVNKNSPVVSNRILNNENDIDKAIHSFSRKELSSDTINHIVRLLTYNY